MSNRILPPGSLFDALMPVIDATEEEFNALLDAISGDCSFHLGDDELKFLDEHTSFDERTILILMNALGYLYFRFEDTRSDFSDINAQVHTLFLELGEKNTETLDKPENFKQRINSLLQDNPVHRRYTQAARLQNGFIPSVQEISTFLDVRPSFDESLENIDGFIEIIQLGIQTNSENPFERKFTVQLNKTQLRELKKAVERLDKKITVLENTTPFTEDIIDIK